ncbi:MAG: alpha/beta hydrolase [Chitinophagaceae bacterium]|nr:alpha/beta hydrolase [Chitinophagaceae bacterium]
MNTPLFSSQLIQVNDIDLHYLHYANESLPKLLLMHGLTANAHAFGGLIQAGLAKQFEVISVDLRGRGLSAKPAFAYSIREHAEDIIGLLDNLNIESIYLCGHSFGGLLSTYLAYHFPDRVQEVIVLDAAPEMNPKVAEMLVPAISRLDIRFDNFDAYIEKVKQAPYIHFWDDAMLHYYEADVATAADGSVEPRSSIADITQIAIASSKEPWATYFEEMKQRTLLLNAVEEYTLGQPLLPDFLAKKIVQKMKNASYLEVGGNHQTMLYGEHANEIVRAIQDFLLVT